MCSFSCSSTYSILLSSFIRSIQMIDQSFLVILFSVLIAVVIAYVLLTQRSKKYGNTVVITGEIGSGKTVLFHQLKESRLVPTLTSLSTNKGSFVPHGLEDVTAAQTWSYVDVPGHGSFTSTLNSLMDDARMIVLVVDASDQLLLRNVGQRLYSLYSNFKLVTADVPVVVALNKTDKAGAASVDKVQSSLQDFIQRAQKAKKGTQELGNLGGDAETRSHPIVRGDSDFSFANASLTTSFVSIVAKDGKVEELIKEMDRIVSKN
jgi:signal recognition particle receptor subunit beta